MATLVNNNKLNILKSVFGYTQFRPLQEATIDAVLDKQDTLLVMPTGGGKSICYQIPALMFDGLTVVISPLISLMKDQVSQLKALGVEAELLNSTLTWEEYTATQDKIRSGKTKLLFCAPETLFKDQILSMLASCKVECITVDEAHCISEWGHDFRPEYRRLKDIRPLFPKAVFLAVTATATPQVRRDITVNLNLFNAKIFLASFNRDNLFYEVIPKNNPTDQVIDILRRFNGQSGIIYCFSRNQVDTLTDEINRMGHKALPYHAGLNDETRNRNQELFIRDDVPIIVATIAFGMGINKPNVRFVIHFDLPKNIESYYQETGRAGRDGLPAQCILLFSAGDGVKIRYFIDQKEDAALKRVAYGHLNTIIAFAQTLKCRRQPLISYFGEVYIQENCGLCDNCTKPQATHEDLTIEAVKFLQCISETDERFGAMHVINVLRGSQNEKVLKFNHNHCATFGAGKNLTIKQWQYLVNQFLMANLVDKDDEFGVLSLNKNSYEILSNKRGFKGVRLKEEIVEPKATASVRQTFNSTDYDKELFERLRRKRKELADQNGVPPYIIFSDKALIDMCHKRPKTKSEFSQVFGVGEQKLERFAEIFIRTINSH